MPLLKAGVDDTGRDPI